MANKTIIEEVLHLPFQSLQFAIEAKRCDYTGKESIHIFFVMFTLLLKSICFSKKIGVSQKFFGFTFYAHNYSTILFLFREVFVYSIYHTELSCENPFIIDCGAHAGMTSCFFSYKYPKCKILAFEPDPLNYHYLLRNISVNKLNVKAFNVALSKEISESSLFLQEDGKLKSIASSLYQQPEQSNKIIKVRISPLSYYLKKDETVNILKLDVEGAEFDIIDDLKESNLLENCLHISMEYHSKKQYQKLSGFLKNLEEANFNYYFRAVSYDHFSSNSLIIKANKNLKEKTS